MDLLEERAELTAAGLPTFEEDEIETLRQDEVHVYNEDHSNKSAAGVALMTTCRILWISGGAAGAVRLEHVVRAAADGGGFFGFGLANSAKILLVFTAGGAERRLKLAFHGSGRDDFLGEIDRALKAKSWQKYVKPEKSRGLEGGMAGVRSGQQKEEKMAVQTMSGAFSDLDGLMARAKEMVALAGSIAQTAAAAKTDSDDETNELGSIMANAGIDNPVTRDVAGSSYHLDLARQLADFLSEPLQKSHGVMTLTDVYCLYNAARGIEMVSPMDLKKACLSFEKLRLPLRLRNLKSGVTVVESEMATEEHVDERMKAAVADKDQGVSVEELANTSSISLYIAKEQLEGAEARGVLARDESIQGVRYFTNLFLMD